MKILKDFALYIFVFTTIGALLIFKEIEKSINPEYNIIAAFVFAGILGFLMGIIFFLSYKYKYKKDIDLMEEIKVKELIEQVSNLTKKFEDENLTKCNNIILKEFKEIHLQKFNKSNEDFKTWGNKWKDDANKALALLERESIKSQILTFNPEDYPRVLINEGIYDENHNLYSDPVTKITLVGSMVGFYVLLPPAIRNYICCLGNKFKTLNIIATSQPYNNLNQYQLAYFALAFVGKTMKTITEGRCKKCFSENEDLSFSINLCFSHFDFMNAAIVM